MRAPRCPRTLGRTATETATVVKLLDGVVKMALRQVRIAERHRERLVRSPLSPRRASTPPPRRIAAGSPPMRLSGKAGVAAQALLLDPKRAWQVHDLAKEAQVSPGLAQRVLARLEREGILAAEGTGPKRVRRVTNPTALLDLCTEENVEQPTRTLGHLLAQTPQQLIREKEQGRERTISSAPGSTTFDPGARTAHPSAGSDTDRDGGLRPGTVRTPSSGRRESGSRRVRAGSRGARRLRGGTSSYRGAFGSRA